MAVPSWARVLADLDRAGGLVMAARAEMLAGRAEPAPGELYGRRSLHRDSTGEAMLAGWRVGAELAGGRLPRDAGDRFLTTGSPVQMRRAAGTAWGIEIGPCERVRIGR